MEKLNYKKSFVGLIFSIFVLFCVFINNIKVFTSLPDELRFSDLSYFMYVFLFVSICAGACFQFITITYTLKVERYSKKMLLFIISLVFDLLVILLLFFIAYFAQVEAKDPDNIENIDEIVSGVLNLSFSELNLTLFIPLLTLFSAIIGFDIYELKVKMINEQIARENIDGYNNVLTKEKFEEKIAELAELYEQKVIDEAKYNKLKEDITDKYIKSKMQI